MPVERALDGLHLAPIDIDAHQASAQISGLRHELAGWPEQPVGDPPGDAEADA